MTIIFLSVFIVLPATCQNWDSTMYDKYNYKTVLTYTPAQQRINPDSIDIPLMNALVFYETNRQRVLNKLPEFKHSTLLEKCAQGHSDDMNHYNFFSHKSVVKGKETMTDRLKLVGLENIACAENINNYYMLPFNDKPYYPPSQVGRFENEDREPIEVYTYIDMAKALVDAWMHSKGHRANILNKSLTRLGAGNSVYYKGEGIDKVPYIYSTQNFGTF
jgi:uncharacterized protein YkwD